MSFLVYVQTADIIVVFPNLISWTGIIVLDSRLAEVSNMDMHPENRQLVTACWISKQTMPAYPS